MDYARTLGLGRDRPDRLSKAVIRSLDLEDEMRILKSSQSWRLTTPLRDGAKALRRLRSGHR